MNENEQGSNKIYNPYTDKVEMPKEDSKAQPKPMIENGNNLNNLFSEKENNFIDMSQSQIFTSQKENIKKQNDLQKSQTNIRPSHIPQRHHHSKKKIQLNLTEDEEIYYYNLFESLDKNDQGKLDSITASSFIKKSGISKHILKDIWLLAVKSSINYITRDEFYLTLRLIALAQNNMPYTLETIEKNDPIPPLPNFKYKIKISDRIMYKISENNKKAYKRIFENNKDNKSDVDITSRKAINIWSSANASDDFIKKIAALVTPLEKKDILI